MSRKHKLRRELIEKRLILPSFRKEEAKKLLFLELQKYLEKFSLVLSFASKEEEIDLWPLNTFLATQKKLVLTKVSSKKHLVCYQVIDIKRDLVFNSRWNVKEPIVERCHLILPHQIECVLVPGLGFDKNHHRLGYGVGYYDRFLKKVSCPTYGIGFKEQLLLEPIPIERHDVSLSDVFLF